MITNTPKSIKFGSACVHTKFRCFGALVAAGVMSAVLCFGMAPRSAVASSSVTKLLDGHGYVTYDANDTPTPSGVLLDAIQDLPIQDGHVMDFAGNDLVVYDDGTITDDQNVVVGFVFHDVISTGP